MARKKRSADGLDEKKNVELRQIARESGIEFPDRYERAELLEAIRNQDEDETEDDDVQVVDQVDIVEEPTTQ